VLDLLGIARNYDVATINETVASMVGKEIGAQVYTKYYATDKPATQLAPITKSTFDFNAAMREIRKTVDSYLANGEITTAEQYMEQQRRYLATNGYYIRKLNQAYFAFYGSYADSPTSISPIGTKLQKLRSRSASLKEFLSTVANVNSVQDLDKILTTKNTETVGF
jgi:predicted alpha/beta-fold hydrolase